MTHFDRSECFRGLLLLIGQDGTIAQDERALIMHIGKILDFNGEFSKSCIDELLDNRYINRVPPPFSTIEIAEAFLKDAVRIAFTDGVLHPKELEWLVAIAETNRLTGEWLEQEILAFKNGTASLAPMLHIERYV